MSQKRWKTVSIYRVICVRVKKVTLYIWEEWEKMSIKLRSVFFIPSNFHPSWGSCINFLIVMRNCRKKSGKNVVFPLCRIAIPWENVTLLQEATLFRSIRKIFSKLSQFHVTKPHRISRILFYFHKKEHLKIFSRNFNYYKSSEYIKYQSFR